MGIDVAQLYSEELTLLNAAVDLLGIPADVFMECGTSYLTMLVESETGHILDPKPESGADMLSKLSASDGGAADKFKRLCDAVPHIPRSSVSSLSLAYGAFSMITNNGKDMSGLEASGGSEMKSLEALLSIAFVRGVALGHAGVSEGVLTIVQENMARKRMLSEAAAKIHVENRAAKVDVFAWLDANFNACDSMDDAAGKMAGKLVPYKFRTVRDWVGQWKKLRSAGTP